MYFEDLTKYEYMETEDSLNIGWLQKGHPFNQGEVPDEFIKKLWKYLRYPVHVCRGFYICDFCEMKNGGLPTVTFQHEKRGVGYYQIRVWGTDGTLYAAPSLILHYILKHNYKPPQEFIDAVMDSDASSDEYYRKILAYSGGDDFWLKRDCTKIKTPHRQNIYAVLQKFQQFFFKSL